MSLIGYWRSEEQTRVGERARKVSEEKKNFAGKVNKIANMIVRIVTFEGLQPMATEAFMRENEINQCRLEVEDSNRNWKITSIVIIIIGFAVMTFAMWKLYKYFEDRYLLLMPPLGNRVDEAELRMVEIEYMVDCKGYDERRNRLYQENP